MFLYNFAYWLDCKLGYMETFKGEYAPYCGHGYTGHTGKFTESYYSEVGGVKHVKVLQKYLYIGNDDYYEKPEGWYLVIKPFWNTRRR